MFTGVVKRVRDSRGFALALALSNLADFISHYPLRDWRAWNDCVEQIFQCRKFTDMDLQGQAAMIRFMFMTGILNSLDVIKRAAVYTGLHVACEVKDFSTFAIPGVIQQLTCYNFSDSSRLHSQSPKRRYALIPTRDGRRRLFVVTTIEHEEVVFCKPLHEGDGQCISRAQASIVAAQVGGSHIVTATHAKGMELACTYGDSGEVDKFLCGEGGKYSSEIQSVMQSQDGDE